MMQRIRVPPVEPVSGAIKGYGLKAVVSAESKALAETAPLKIMGNTAERGGGVGTNGEVIIPGEDTLENPVSLTVHKVWSGASAYPTAVTVNLIRIAKDGTRTAIGTVLLSERSTDKDGKTWSYTFANLNGAYTYTVEEEAVDGFNTSISGSMAMASPSPTARDPAAAVAAAVTTSRTRNRLPILIRSLRLTFRISLHRLIR